MVARKCEKYIDFNHQITCSSKPYFFTTSQRWLCHHSAVQRPWSRESWWWLWGISASQGFYEKVINGRIVALTIKGGQNLRKQSKSNLSNWQHCIWSFLWTEVITGVFLRLVNYFLLSVIVSRNRDCIGFDATTKQEQAATALRGQFWIFWCPRILRSFSNIVMRWTFEYLGFWMISASQRPAIFDDPFHRNSMCCCQGFPKAL